MSRKKGTAEKLFTAIYAEKQDAEDFKRRAFHNQGIAVEGANGGIKHEKARYVRAAYTAIDMMDQLNAKERDPAKIESLKWWKNHAKEQIYTYIENALKTSNGEPLRLLADILDNKIAKSDDAFALIEFCLTKPHTHIFTFKELRDGFAHLMNLKPPYDEAIEKRLRRLISVFGIRIRKRQ